MIPFLDLHQINSRYSELFKKAFEQALHENHWILGPSVELFEKNFANYCNAGFCVGVGNGLDALAIGLLAAGISPGDEVIVPAHTFIATWLCVSQIGATIIPCPCDDTMTIDPTRIAQLITAKTKAIIPVHLYGQCADMDPINAIAEKLGLFVLEDAAQAHGALYKGRKAGSLGHAAAFSFYPGKNLGALGDGGALVLSNEEMANKARMIRNYGSSIKYHHETMGVNSRLDALQAKMLSLKLLDLDEDNAKRSTIADIYNSKLSDPQYKLGLTIPRQDAQRQHAWHLYTVLLDDPAARMSFQNFLADKGIQTIIHYPIACCQQKPYHMQQYFDAASIDVASRTVSLPMGPTMTHGEALEVCEAIIDFFKPTPRHAPS